MRGMLVAAGLSLGLAGGASAVTLGIDGTRFTLDGTPDFLLGISYYGGLGAPREFVRQDFDDMRDRGWNWVRVWATWEAGDTNVSAVDEDGEAREEYLSMLTWLVAQADARGMVVDVTLSRGDLLPNQGAHLKAVRVLATALKPWRNVYIDLANERDVRDSRYVSLEELGELSRAVRQVDPERLITASGVPNRESLRAYGETAGVNFICPHLGRTAESPGRTLETTRQFLRWMADLDRAIPVHYQEPFRRDYSAWQPAADDFLTDLRGALEGGAAGWCLHNGSPRGEYTGPDRSFNMSRDRGRLFDQLDEEEMRVVNEAPALVKERWR